MSTESKSVEKVENKKPQFKNKLQSKAAKLPEASESVAPLVKALEQLTLDDLEDVRAYADYEMRRKTLECAVEVEWKPEVGNRITVKNCELVRFNGCSGVVQKVSRIRCIVKLDDGRHGYFFLSNVFPADDVQAEPAVTE